MPTTTDTPTKPNPTNQTTTTTTTKPPKPKRLNLRRPDIMAKVQAQTTQHYSSPIIDHLRTNGNTLTIPGTLTIRLAKQFGFCYGVQRAIDLAYAARKTFPPQQRILLLGEIIHNPEVNHQLKTIGIQPLASRPTPQQLQQLTPQDVIIIPAFGTEIHTRKTIEKIGCTIVDTTCGDVMTVWKRVRQYAKNNITSIIHGKAQHEETKATSSQATANNGHYLIILTPNQIDHLCNYIQQPGNPQQFLQHFQGAHSQNFNPDKHLTAIGIANQTTMLRGETQQIQQRLKHAITQRYGQQNLHKHFHCFDTICGATQDRQDALQNLLTQPLNLLLVIGGYNSSNTSHLAEIGKAKLPTYFIKNATKLISQNKIIHYNPHQNQETTTHNWLKPPPQTIGLTAGASCPNNLIEDTIKRLFQLHNLNPTQHLPHI